MERSYPAGTALVLPQPAVRGAVGHDPVRRGPAGTEELGHEGLPGSEQPALVLGMGVALLGEQEARPGHDRVRTRAERGLDVGALGNAAREPDREARREPRPREREELQRRRLAA